MLSINKDQLSSLLNKDKLFLQDDLNRKYKITSSRKNEITCFQIQPISQPISSAFISFWQSAKNGIQELIKEYRTLPTVEEELLAEKERTYHLNFGTSQSVSKNKNFKLSVHNTITEMRLNLKENNLKETFSDDLKTAYLYDLKKNTNKKMSYEQIKEPLFPAVQKTLLDSLHQLNPDLFYHSPEENCIVCNTNALQEWLNQDNTENETICLINKYSIN